MNTTPLIPMEPIKKETLKPLVPEDVYGRLFQAFCVIIVPIISLFRIASKNYGL